MAAVLNQTLVCVTQDGLEVNVAKKVIYLLSPFISDYYCNRLTIADARPELNFLVDSLLKVGIAYCK